MVLYGIENNIWPMLSYGKLGFREVKDEGTESMKS